MGNMTPRIRVDHQGLDAVVDRLTERSSNILGDLQDHLFKHLATEIARVHTNHAEIAEQFNATNRDIANGFRCTVHEELSILRAFVTGLRDGAVKDITGAYAAVAPGLRRYAALSILSPIISAAMISVTLCAAVIASRWEVFAGLSAAAFEEVTKLRVLHAAGWFFALYCALQFILSYLGSLQRTKILEVAVLELLKKEEARRINESRKGEGCVLIQKKAQLS